MKRNKILVKDKDELNKIIINAGFSARQLAKNANCSQTHISLILKGERNPSPELAKKIIDILKCKFEDIFFITNDYFCN